MDRSPGIRGALAACALAVAVLFVPRVARADAPAPAPGSWGAELESVAAWMAQRNGASACSEHCFVLTRLHLAGAADGEMRFSLEGAVLADKPVAVPLFGPPTHAHIDRVTENGKLAAVGFEQDHWFVLTASRRFVLEGTLSLEGDLALTLPGPLDALDAELTRGRVVEGAHLSGLVGATVHFDRDAVSAPAEEPPVFQLSRAIRIGRETTFEYRLVMRSGKDLGVVRLPLAFGEKVLDVQGSSGWSLQGKELVLPTAGRSAQVTVTGALASIPRVEPDARSSYEWWLVESDAEHRLTVGGDARQIDASQSPIARTQPSARLFMVARGQHLDIAAQALVATEALAAVVSDHHRTIVLTARGDLVADDTLSYENDGIDWLTWPPTGRAVFLATDNRAERVMRAADGAGEILVPLRVGSHSLHLQSMASESLGLFGGSMVVPTPTHALATSRATLTLGLSRGVHPIAVLGGDRPWVAFGTEDALALVASIVVALLALRGRLRRTLGAVALGGLWLLSAGAWMLLVGAGVVSVASWAAARLLQRGPRLAAWAVIGVAAFIGGVASMGRHAPSHAVTTATAEPQAGFAGDLKKGEQDKQKDLPDQDAIARASAQSIVAGAELWQGQENGRLALDGGIVQGVAPVALPLPAYERSIVIARELVTRDRPLTLHLVYITTSGLAPLVGLWLLCLGFLARLYSAQIARISRLLRERLARRPEPDLAPPVPVAPPPVVA
ncbi:MAG TPA: hypothetical protein VGL81_19965 [Polyangiaceae bacterium]|jgi:hypothetical protein